MTDTELAERIEALEATLPAAGAFFSFHGLQIVKTLRWADRAEEALRESVEQFRFYDGRATIKNHDKPLMDTIDALLSERTPQEAAK